MKTKTLIFGGADGIGRAIADELTHQGGEVHITSRSADKINANPYAGNVCDVLDAAQISDAVTAAGPGLTGLVFAVGSIVLKPLKSLKDADFLDAFRLNTLGAALAMQAAAPVHRMGGGLAVFNCGCANRLCQPWRHRRC